MPEAPEPFRGLAWLVLAAAWAIQPVCSAAADAAGIQRPLDLSAAVESSATTAPLGKDDTDGGSNTSAVGLKPANSGVRLRGFTQAEVARTIADPEHWSKMRVRSELTAQGRINEAIGWKMSGRVDYDAVYDVTDFYPGNVRRNQRLNFFARENYLDVAAGDWDIRIGRQHVIWGEVVGLFFADVVSARDMREFILPDFDILRIPQWAARAEYTRDDFHAEFLWIPVATYDKIGVPGAEFFPPLPFTPPGFSQVYLGDRRPARNLSNSNYGVRASILRNGWDVSGFYYRSTDASPTFARQFTLGPQPTAVFEARHDRITQLGSTIAKDFGWTVGRAELVYTQGRQFSVIRPSDPDGLVKQNTLDWILGLDFTLPAEVRFNVQLFQRVFFDHDPDILLKQYESGYSLYLTKDLTSQVEAQLLFISSLERTDWMVRPKLIWKFEKNWRLTTGIDAFNGPALGLFGRFANRDRAYAEVRYSF